MEKVDINDANVIFNGEELFTYQREELMPQVGDVCLIFDGGRCTTVVISSYTTKIVKNVSPEFEKIYFDYSGGAVDYSKDEFNIYLDGDKIRPDELQGMDIALVSYAKSGFVNEMIVSRGVLEGTIDSIDSRGYYYIGDTEYNLSPQLYDYSVNYGPGSKIKFYLDAYGSIAYIKRTDSENYAFLVGAKKSTGISDELVLKLLTSDGTVQEYSVDNKTTFNGAKTSVSGITGSLLNADGGLDYQLLKIKHNSNRVLKSIETAVDNISGDYTEDFSRDLIKESKQWRYYNNFLSKEILDDTDVLIWWGHARHNDVPDETAKLVHDAVLEGMGMICLHSAHHSKPFKLLTGTSCNLSWRLDGDSEYVWVCNPAHPITQGIDRYIKLEHEEIYSEPFDIPEPNELIMIGSYEGGEVFRSACCYYRGNGKIFYFQPGHETYPTFYNPQVQLIIKNAVYWAKPTYRSALICPKISKIK